MYFARKPGVQQALLLLMLGLIGGCGGSSNTATSLAATEAATTELQTNSQVSASQVIMNSLAANNTANAPAASTDAAESVATTPAPASNQSSGTGNQAVASGDDDNSQSSEASTQDSTTQTETTSVESDNNPSSGSTGSNNDSSQQSTESTQTSISQDDSVSGESGDNSTSGSETGSNDTTNSTEAETSEQSEISSENNSETDSSTATNASQEQQQQSTSTQTQGPIRILPLGDSITQGGSGYPGYRRQLWFMLKNAGFNVDFVGSGNDFASYVPQALHDFDMDHEGHWAWEAGQLQASLPGWLQGYTPDIVLLHAGTNDFDRGQDNAGTMQELSSIIDILRDKNPQVVILVARLIPMRHRDTTSINVSIQALQQSKHSEQSPVVLVDQYSGYDPYADNHDNYHPNTAGEEKMATRWFDALSPYL